MRARARAWRVRVRDYSYPGKYDFVMENKAGLYRMLVDASCAIFQNLSAVSDLMSDSAVNSAKKSLREIAMSAFEKCEENYRSLMSE